MVRYTSQVFVDESGTARQTPYVVFGALKVGTDLGLLVNQISRLSSREGFTREVRFSATNKTTLGYYSALVDAVSGSRARFSGLVVERSLDPFRGEQWRSQAYYTIEAIKFALSNDERSAAIVDDISVPGHVNFESYIQAGVNAQYGNDDRRLVSVVRMDSTACWGLQLVDLLTGAVHLSARLAGGDSAVNRSSPKAQLADHVRNAFNVPELHEATTPRFRVRAMFRKADNDAPEALK